MHVTLRHIYLYQLLNHMGRSLLKTLELIVRENIEVQPFRDVKSVTW